LNFGFGSFHLPLGLPKNKETFRKTQKEETKDSQECLGPGLSSEVLLFCYFWVFFCFWCFLCFLFLLVLVALCKENKPIVLQTLPPDEIVFDCFCLGFVLCLLYPYPPQKKTGS